MKNKRIVYLLAGFSLLLVIALTAWKSLRPAAAQPKPVAVCGRKN